MIKTIGVYQIFIGDYFYHGSSEDCEGRLKKHLQALKRGNHINNKMQNVYNKYQTFDCQIVMQCDNRDVAYAYEQDFIDTHFGLDKCLNINEVASKPPGFLGKKHSDETKQKMSKSMKGKPSHNKGKSMSEEQKKKISNSRNRK